MNGPVTKKLTSKHNYCNTVSYCCRLPLNFFCKYSVNTAVLGTRQCLAKHSCYTTSSNGSTTPRKRPIRWNRTAYLVKNDTLWQRNQPAELPSLPILDLVRHWQLCQWARSWAYSGFGRFVLKAEYDIVLRPFGDLREY